MGKETIRNKTTMPTHSSENENRCSLKRPARMRITVCVALCHTLVLSGGRDGRPRNVKRILYPQSQSDTDWRIRHDKWVEWDKAIDHVHGFCTVSPFPAFRTVAAEGNRAEGEISSPHSAEVCANSCISSAGPTRPTRSNQFWWSNPLLNHRKVTRALLGILHPLNPSFRRQFSTLQKALSAREFCHCLTGCRCIQMIRMCYCPQSSFVWSSASQLLTLLFRLDPFVAKPNRPIFGRYGAGLLTTTPAGSYLYRLLLCVFSPLSHILLLLVIHSHHSLR